MVLAQPAEAKIVYTKTHRVIKVGSDLLALDLNHDGVIDFTFYLLQSSNGSGLAVYGCTFSDTRTCVTNSIWTSNRARSAAALRPGFVIGRKGERSHKARMAGGALISGSRKTTWGNWLNVKNRYLGLKFVIKGKTHVGWARLSATWPPVQATLTGYAYETIPNKSIVAGRTKGPDVVAVQPATLGHLAHGAAWRVKQGSTH
jgi:hypothetical protein